MSEDMSFYYFIRKNRVSRLFSELLLALLLIQPLSALAATYAPGETLNPSCLPTDSSCTVNVTTFSSGLTVGTTTPSSTTNRLYNTSGVLYWNGSQLSGIAGGITSINGLSTTTQTFATGSSGADFGITSSGSTHTFNIPTASSTVRGLLSSTDWTTFNSKEPAITASTTATYFRGDKTFQTLNTSAVTENTNLYYTDARARAALSATSPLTYSSSTGAFGINQASSSANGYLSSTDWSTFNSKLGTALNSGLVWVGNGSNVATAVSFSGDVTIANTGALTIAADAVALGADTTGNYVATITAGTGISGSSSAEGGTPTIAIDQAASLSWTGAHTFATSSGVALLPHGASAGNTTELRFRELAVNGTNYVGLKSADSLAGNVLWTLPNADGTSGQVLQTSGSSALSWATPFSNSLSSGNIFVGNGSNVATGVALSGDATISNAGALTLANSGVTAASYGSTTTIPVITVDSKGRITLASSTSTPFTVSGLIANADVASGAAIALSKLASGSSIVTSLAAPSGSNANGGSITSNALTLSLADGTNPGLVSTGAQTIAGAKTFSATTTLGNSLVVDTNTFYVDAANNRVGVGTTTPDKTLTVSGDAKIVGGLLVGNNNTFGIDAVHPFSIGDNTQSTYFSLGQGPGVGFELGWAYNATSSLAFGLIGTAGYANAIAINASTVHLQAYSGGYVAIGQSTAAYRLDLPNTASAAGQGRANAWVTYSDAKLKENVVSLDNNLVKILSLRPVSFDWKKSGAKGTGFIAQEAEIVLPEVVSEGSDGLKAIDYGHVTPFLVGAVQEQQLQIAGIMGTTSLAFVNSPDTLFATDASVDEASSADVTLTAEGGIAGFIKAKIAGGVKVMRNLVAERVTAVQGYFKRIFANELCLTDSSGAVVCVTGDQLKNIGGSATQTSSLSTTNTASTNTSLNQNQNTTGSNAATETSTTIESANIASDTGSGAIATTTTDSGNVTNNTGGTVTDISSTQTSNVSSVVTGTSTETTTSATDSGTTQQ